MSAVFASSADEEIASDASDAEISGASAPASAAANAAASGGSGVKNATLSSEKSRAKGKAKKWVGVCQRGTCVDCCSPCPASCGSWKRLCPALPLQAHSYARRCGFKDCTIAFIIMENHRNLIAHMFADGPHAARLLRAVGTPAAMAASLSAGASTQLFASSDPLPLKRKAVGDWIREDTYAVADDA